MRESELITAARAGDEDAFKKLYELHCGDVRRAANAILQTDDVDDVIQEVFISAWRGLKNFRGESKFRTWITSIARNACFKGRIATNRQRQFEADDEGLSEAQELTIWKHAAADVEPLIALERLLAGLPLESRELLEMNREGLSDKEIAEATSLSLRTVRGRLQRGRVSMRKRFYGAPEQIGLQSPLISDKANSRGKETTKMAKPGKKGRPQRESEGVDVVGRSRWALLGGGEVDYDEASAPFSFEDLVAEVAQLEYLAAIEARRQFDAEVTREAGNRLLASVRTMLVAKDLDPGHEEAVLADVVTAIAALPIVREDLNRLQHLRMGVHSREVRLWYFETVAQNLLSDSISRVAQGVSSVSTSARTENA